MTTPLLTAEIGQTLLDICVADITTLDVDRRVRSIRPTSEVKSEEIGELRRWAQDHLAIDAGHGRAGDVGERLLEL